MKHVAAKLVLSGLAILMAITPVPFEKWAWQRIAFGILGLAGAVSTKSNIDQEMEEQRLVDVQIFEEKLYERELAQVQRQLALDAARQQEAIRFGLQTKMATADYQGAFVTLMEEKHPYYLDALQAQQKSALDAQQRVYSTGSQNEGSAIVSADGSEALPVSVEPQDKGQRLLQRLRKSDMSILVVGSTGAGKSHTLSAYLEFLYQDFPDADVWVISRKNDSFCGLREANRVVRFNSLDPVDALEKLREIHAIFQERTEVLEEDRPRLSTIRLILEDWSSICLILKKNKVIWNEVQIILSDIVTVGRELNIALFILAQSAILESLGLVGDANLRTCLAIVAQGLESINNKGEKQGDYNLIQLILKNAYIIPSDEDRRALTEELVDLISKSRSIKQPVFLCTGGEPFVGLLPKITKAKLPVGVQGDRSAPKDSNTSQQRNTASNIETQKEQLDATFNKAYNPLDHLLQEANQEQLEELIRSWREMADTSKKQVSDTSQASEVSDTQIPEYRSPESLPDKEYPRIWGEGDFQRYLPNEDENDFFERLLVYQDTNPNASHIIKKCWKFSRGESYRRLGQPAFVYIIEKYGTDRQKKLYAPYITQYLAKVENSESEEDDESV